MTMIAETHSTRLLVRVAKFTFVVLFPLVLVLIAARLIMTPLFLQFEYNRADFPPDPYGLTREDRLNYAPYLLDYLLNSAGIEYLGDLQFPNGESLFDTSELRHMRDVKTVTQIAFGGAIVGGVIVIFAGYYLYRSDPDQLRGALRLGALLTLAIVATIVILTVVNWEFFFTLFHQLFFEGGTWYFPTSDTLIRLFPEQFWFDAALLVGGITVVTAMIVLIITLRFKSP